MSSFASAFPEADRAALRAALRQGAGKWIARFYRHELLVARTVRGMQIEAAEEFQRTVIRPVLREVAGRLANFDLRGPDIVIEAFPELRAMRDEVLSIVNRGSDAVRRLTTERLHDLVRHESEWLQDAAKKTLKVEVPKPSVAETIRRVDERPYLGETVERWFSKALAGATGDKARAWIQTGLQNGLTTDEIVRGLRGSKDTDYTDGILSRQRDDVVKMLVQSAAAHASSTARFESFKAIGVQQWRWLATLDTKTCPICIANEQGSPYNMGEGPTFPAHPRDRCSPVPWFGEPIGTRASTDGQVPARVTVDEWLRDKPASEQDEVFGKTKASAWRAGKLSVHDMLGKDLQPLTLEELRRLDFIPVDG